MIEIDISESIIEKAKILYPFNELKGSITKGKSNIYGALGELVVFDFFKERTIDFNSTYDYDLIIDGYKIDVKTKNIRVVPKLSFLCTIASYNTSQKCDYYFFSGVNLDLKKAYLYGYISKFDFYKKSVFNKKGQHDYGGYKFPVDCYNLEISKLNKFKPN